MNELALPVGGGLVLMDLIALVALLVVVALVYHSVTNARIRVTGGGASARGVTCGNCGWMGTVSVFAPRCPTCNAQFNYSERE